LLQGQLETADQVLGLFLLGVVLHDGAGFRQSLFAQTLEHQPAGQCQAGRHIGIGNLLPQGLPHGLGILHNGDHFPLRPTAI
jgi:hypothetical protein